MKSSSARPLTLMADKIRLSAVEVGEKDSPIVVLVAGWPQTIYAWRLMLPTLAEAGFRALAIDPPGLGDSDVLPQGVHADTGTVADIMSAALANYGASQFTLVGHDVGSWISYAWATRRPAGIERLCLTEADIPGVAPPAAFAIERAPRVFQFFFCATPDLPELLTEGRERIFFKYLFDTKMLVRQAINDSDLSHYVESYARPGRMTAGFAYYRAAIESARQNSAAAPPRMPVLAIGGEGSVGSALHRALEAAKTPHLQGAVFAGVGHYLPEEAPREFVDHIVRFVRLRT